MKKTPTPSPLAERIKAIKEQPDKPYFIRYGFETGRFGREDAGEDHGLTQDFIFISCITGPDGSYSQDWNAVNGQKDEPLSHDDVFKAWILMAKTLSEKPDLNVATRAFLSEVFEVWCSTAFAARPRYSVGTV